MIPLPIMNIIRIDSIPSTNSFLKELTSKEKLEDGTVVITSDQTSGRGQMGTFWESEPGKNLTFSIVLYPVFLPIKSNFLISELIALSLKKVLAQYTDHLFIKWPNDLYYKDKKIAGILIENEITGNQISQSVIGIGLNVNQEIFKSDAPNPVSLKQILTVDFDLDLLLKEIIAEITHYYDILKKGEKEIIRELYHTSLYRGSGFHSFTQKNGEKFVARIEAVEDNGTIRLITNDGETRFYAFKEIIFT